jgi:diacylglycerol kinase (ATP)
MTTNKLKIRFIANPFSGVNKAQNLEKYIHQYLDKDKFEYDVQYTRHSGHAIELAKDASEKGYFGVIAAGGDGTINEVASSLIGSATALGIIPMGSGNGFSYHLKTNRNISRAFAKINATQISPMDAGKANDHVFVNVSGLGLDAKVASHTKTNKWRGLMPYILNTIRYGLFFKAPYIQAKTVEGLHIEGKYIIAAVANGSIYGYEFAISPLSEINDGYLDVILVEQRFPLAYFGLAWRSLRGDLLRSPMVKHFKTKGIELHFPGNTYIHLDGEPMIMRDHIQFSILHHSINLLS